MRLPKDHRLGQVWVEKWGGEQASSVYLVLGTDMEHDPFLQVYRLVNLETGNLDWVSPRMLDMPEDEWDRIA